MSRIFALLGVEKIRLTGGEPLLRRQLERLIAMLTCIDGLDLLRSVAESDIDTMTIIMTGYGTVETAIEAMKKGAFDYILKPFKPEEVVQVLRRGLEKQRLERENFELRESMTLVELSDALASAMPLEEQLAMIVEMVADAFGAGAVQIIVADPHRPGTYLSSAVLGAPGMRPKVELLISTLATGEKVLAHGEEIGRWLENPVTAELEVQTFMAAALRIRGAPFGIINAYGFAGRRFTEGQRKGLSFFAGRAATAIDVARMYANLTQTFTQTMEGFARAIEAKDRYTFGHSDRVAMYSRIIAEGMGLSETEVKRIEHGGLMHDIGKIGIRSADLNKPQKLTPEEYKMFKSHPVLGKRIIEPITFLAHLIPCVYHHHETWDGGGYPMGLGGGDIPIEARILAVADSYDAMTSDRPYRKALPHDIALVELRRCAGRQFDPRPVEAFLLVIEKFRAKRRAQGLPLPD